MRRPIHWLLAGLTLFALAGPAEAAAVNLSPTRVSLTQDKPTGLVVLRNEGEGAVRFQVSTFLWEQDPTGAMNLTPTEDLIVYPSLLTIPAGESRIVRVGTRVSPGTIERSWRLIVDELPSTTVANTAGLHMLTRLSVPVFQAPIRAQSRGSIEDVAIEGDSLIASVENAGNRHVMLEEVELVVRDESGREIWHGRQRGWYILAGDHREISLDLPPGLCGAARSVEVSAAVGDETWSTRTAVAATECPP